MIRLIFTVLLALISLLAVFKAFEYHMWLLAIAVTEFPWLFSSVTIVVLLAGFFGGRYVFPGTIIGLIALILFLSPIARAYILEGSVRSEFDAAFGVTNTDSTSAPYSFFKMFKKPDSIGYKKINYVKYADTSMSLDFYPSQILGRKPCVIVVHGGSWAGGDSQQLPELNSLLAKKGYNVASINYRMAPKWQTPAPVEDIVNTIKYMREHADELNIDTTQFVLIGRSAGAQIALLAAYTMHEKDLKGVVDFYGPADMVWGYSIPSNPLIMDSRKVMDQYIGGSFSQVPMKYYDCSPLNFVNEHSVPTLLIHGSNDVLVSPEHSHRLNGALHNNHIKHYWLQIPWATHGFDYNLNGPGGQISTYTVLQFLHTICPPTP